MAPRPDVSMHFAFLYPQLKKLTGAQRLILRLAEATVAAGAPVTIVTHRMTDEPRMSLSHVVSLVETGRRVDYTGNHYADAALEYALSAALVTHIPSSATVIVGFGPPSMPALWWMRHRHAPNNESQRPLLAFLYEPPRFVDYDRADAVSGLGRFGSFMTPMFSAYGAIDRRLVASADRLLANGTYGASRLRQTYGREATVVTHGVDFAEPSADAIAALRRRYGIAPGAPLMLSVNQLHPRKRLELFIRTLALVRRQHPDLRGMLVGRGVDEARLRSEAQLRGVTDALIFTRFVPDHDLPAVYGAATVYVHTGRAETFGLSVLEAAWSGVPVIAVDEGGPREILDNGSFGLLVPATVVALAEGVRSILEDLPSARKRATAAAANVRARYAWQLGAHALIAAAKDVLSAPQTSNTSDTRVTI